MATATEAGDPDIEDAMDELEELEDLVDSEAEREQVREAMDVVRRVRPPAVFGRVRNRFGAGDAGEAFVGSFVFGIPMVVEGGTLEVGAHIAANPVYYPVTVALGLAVVVGILDAVRADEVEADLLLGVVPIRLLGVLAVATTTATTLMTAWGRVDWGEPWVATAQVTVTAVVMAVGASLGDIIPE